MKAKVILMEILDLLEQVAANSVSKFQNNPSEDSCLEMMDLLQQLTSALGSNDIVEAETLEHHWENTRADRMMYSTESDYAKYEKEVLNKINRVLYPELGAPSIPSNLGSKLALLQALSAIA